ncbi:FimV family protein [Aliikangiella marina]|uniref:FimV family protein n=1 Tax=Aliikangiella marina TaxID=1712262 RepID=A0A545TID6_9GAMM|nr:FimV/HubP family polar landmark protein [Aliikangiella marina]TQV76989.1 FimV family protein [Aliikangiella marina]
MFRKLILVLISSVCCFSTAVFAVGLGESELKSGLNQPLKAEIQLLSVGELAEHEINAQLASAAVFERVGVERPFYLNDIRFETIRENGELKIQMTTRNPVKEPFLNFLVELNSPKERVIREYTFLLDPPVFDDASASTIEQTQTARPATTQSQPRQSAPRQQQPAQQPSFSGSTYGPVTATDTLWSIASRVRPNEQTSIHQTLVAIYRANPDAFANGNINNLLRGKVLQIPDEMSISNVPHRAALQDVVMQNRQWESGGARRIVDGGSDAASNRMSSDARLTLATPDSSSGADANANTGIMEDLRSTQQQLVNAQETSATLQAENDELRARLADALQKLEGAQASGALNIEDTELAALTSSQNQDDAASEDYASTDTIESSDDYSASADDVSSVGDYSDTSSSIDDSGIAGGDSFAEDSSLQDSSLQDSTTQDATGDVTQASDTTQSAQTASSTPTTQPYIPQQPPKSFLDEMLESSMVLWGGALAVLAIVLAVFWRMRKRMEEDDFQDDLVASAGAGTIDATESFELPDVGDDMLVELDMDEEDEDKAESDEENFDPLGEADIYIAYGKYEQAESLLLEAIDDNPIRSDLKVKLMECYAENDDKEKFESLAQEVSQAVDADEWQEQVSNLREQAWSGQASESDGEFDLPSTEDIFGEDDDFGLDDDTPALEDQSSLDEDDALDSSLDLGEDDFSLDEDGDDDEFDIDMDMGMGDDDDASTAVTETFDSIDDDDFALEDSDEEIDLNLDEVDEEDDFSLDDADEDDISLDDSDDISLDLEDDDFDFDEDDSDFDDTAADDGGDEIATKLDLARAYIDMGDSDGAKEILSEVVAEGSEAQKAEAQALLDKAD